MKTPLEIRNELLASFLELEASYLTPGVTCTNPDATISYLHLNMCEHLINAIKALEYHYRDDVPSMRVKKNWDEHMVNAHKVLKKYSELENPENEYSKLRLQRKFDSTGYLAQRDWIEEIKAKKTS